MTEQIQWVNAISTRLSLESAISEVIDRIKKQLSGSADLGVLFISSAYASEYPRLVPLIREKLPISVLVGSGGGGVVGIDEENQAQEVEGNPALSLTVAHLPGVNVQGFQISTDQIPDLDSSAQAWTELTGVSPEQDPHFILLADPFFSKVNDLLEGLDFAYPQAKKVGGLASAMAMGMQTGLFYDSASQANDPPIVREGIVGVALSGNIEVDTIVAQGCRPVGPQYQITKGERNVLAEVAPVSEKGTEEAKPPLEALRELMNQLSPEDQQLAQHSLFLGIARDEFKLELQQGDFLIRNLLGVDPKVGAIAVGDKLRPGQRIQFHLRDGNTSAEDLEVLLKNYKQEEKSSSAVGALLFSCLGRGKELYGQPNFDSQLFRQYIDQIPLGGFFCNGEIGPVGNQTFLHGYTSSFAIFRR
jgi:small ligand-binding sensory domain FIST